MTSQPDGLVSLQIRAHGSAIRVDAPEWSVPGLVAGLTDDASVDRCSGDEDLVADASVTVTARDGTWTVSGVATTVSEPSGDDDRDRAEVLRRLCSEVHLAIAAHARDAVFIHAGAVAWRGIGVVIPGRSMAGKSTLVRALVGAGATYFSDEYAVLGIDGRVFPYAKPVSIRSATGSVQIPGRAIGQVATDAVPVGVVIDTVHRAGATWAPTHRSGATVTLPLVANAVAAQLDPERVLAHTTAVAAGAAILLSGPRGEADAAVPSILATVDQLTRVGTDAPG